jgi:hypothetical protein
VLKDINAEQHQGRDDVIHPIFGYGRLGNLGVSIATPANPLPMQPLKHAL